MNIANLGIVGSAAATPLAQTRGSETERVRLEAVAHQREVDSVDQAEAAAGIGTTNEEQATADRDADGRRAWEIPAVEKPKVAEVGEEDVPGGAKDPTGNAGSQLDLSG